ncbi:WW domain-containing protein [Aspergillus ibericus CBS 121593]|uniref:WW domain-containing protein n=1 Tax=Aspergillus ibericus CBS 121593 TaxID=1448316 RepID=A0A395GTM7_9EURO|nr:hypothetical protein BO80DRAFT_427043 [Aspergillus ibericus CBS 121593]RAK98940.1 hypothetical protein BO80DRAFT_427043 [Aspergillus ibericus CBS 121593]
MSATAPPDAGAPPQDGDQTEARIEAVEGDQEAQQQGTEKAEEILSEGEEEGNLKEKEEQEQEQEQEQEEESEDEQEDSAPPLPDEIPPPLPNEPTPGAPAAAGGGERSGEDDGWEPVWDGTAQAYYFYNRYTGTSQWENPRVPDASATTTTAEDKNAVVEEPDAADVPPPAATVGGYNPAIHGDYDPTAPYAQQYEQQQQIPEAGAVPGVGPGAAGMAGGYDAVGAFNRFTGRWQAASQNAEYHNDENKSRRQMYAFFDVDAAANSHDGRSLRAERSAKKLSKKELKMFKEKRREKKEEKRRAWLRD